MAEALQRVWWRERSLGIQAWGRQTHSWLREKRDETDSAVLCGSVTEAHCQRLLPPALLIMSRSPSPSIYPHKLCFLSPLHVSLWKYRKDLLSFDLISFICLNKSVYLIKVKALIKVLLSLNVGQQRLLSAKHCNYSKQAFFYFIFYLFFAVADADADAFIQSDWQMRNKTHLNLTHLSWNYQILIGQFCNTDTFISHNVLKMAFSWFVHIYIFTTAAIFTVNLTEYYTVLVMTDSLPLVHLVFIIFISVSVLVSTSSKTELKWEVLQNSYLILFQVTIVLMVLALVNYFKTGRNIFQWGQK